MEFTTQHQPHHADSLKADIETLMELVPHSYLNRIIQNARKIDDGAETLILAEEYIVGALMHRLLNAHITVITGLIFCKPAFYPTTSSSRGRASYRALSPNTSRPRLFGSAICSSLGDLAIIDKSPTLPNNDPRIGVSAMLSA
jgi:hypothetical protein